MELPTSLAPTTPLPSLLLHLQTTGIDTDNARIQLPEQLQLTQQPPSTILPPHPDVSADVSSIMQALHQAAEYVHFRSVFNHIYDMLDAYYS